VSTTFALVVVGLLSGTWLLGRVRTPPPVPIGGATGADGRPLASSVSVVVPARDEEATLPRLLASLADQRHPPIEVLVVDDGSTDGTAAVAHAAGASVVTAGPPPPGWLGKPWACRTGAAAASGRHLVFLDADTWLAPDGLDRLLAAHADVGGGLLSVQPRHVTERPYEQLSAFCNLVSMMGTGAFTPAPPGDVPVAFGPCVVSSSAAYRAVGGHDAVAGEVIEDIHLARAYRSSGRPVRCLAGGGAVAFRMYPGGPAQLWEGWAKNLAGGARLARPLPVAGAVAWVAACAAIAVAALLAAVRLAAGRGGATWAPVVGWVVVAAQVRWMLSRVGRFRWWSSVAFPVPLGAFLGIFAGSLVRRSLRRRVRWRGRDIDLHGAAG
jgi:hypothetical protein